MLLVAQITASGLSRLPESDGFHEGVESIATNPARLWPAERVSAAPFCSPKLVAGLFWSRFCFRLRSGEQRVRRANGRCQFAFQTPMQRQIDNRHESRRRRELQRTIVSAFQSHESIFVERCLSCEWKVRKAPTSAA